MAVKTTLQLNGSFTAKGKAMKRLLEGALNEAGIVWHEEIAPKHFLKSAVNEYDYQKRDPQYARRKNSSKKVFDEDGNPRRAGPSQLPLVWSGTMRRMITQNASIKANSKRVNVVMKGPKYFFAFRKDFLQPDKADEVTRFSEADEKRVFQVIDRFMTDGLNQVKTG